MPAEEERHDEPVSPDHEPREHRSVAHRRWAVDDRQAQRRHEEMEFGRHTVEVDEDEAGIIELHEE